MSDPIRVERREGVLEMTIDRPKANAIDAATSHLMGEAFVAFRDDPSLRVAVVTGAGDRFFSAGWDVKAAAAGEAYDSDYGPGGFGGFPELPDLNKPVIVAVNGMAVGGGFEMAMSADLVYAADHAEFLLPEIGIGVIPDVGTVRLPKLLPGPIAREMLLTGRRMGAEEAARWGLVNAVTSASDLMPTVRTVAAEIASGPPLAIAAIIELLRRTEGLDPIDGLALMRSGDVASYEAMLRSDDAREGAQAFVEKREPQWRGR